MRRRWPLLSLIPLCASVTLGLTAVSREPSPEEIVRGLALGVPLKAERRGGEAWSAVRSGPGSYARVRDGIDRALKGRTNWVRRDDGMSVVWSYNPLGPSPWWRRVPGVDRLVPPRHRTASVSLSRGRAFPRGVRGEPTKEPWTTLMMFAYDDGSATASLSAFDGWTVWDAR